MRNAGQTPHRRVFMQQRPALGRRQAPRDGVLILESARELGIRDAQGSEVVLGCEILNRLTELGRPVSYRIGR